MPKILIVGGAGYIGSHTNKCLTQAGFETVVFDNLCLGHREAVKWGDFFLGDLANLGDLKKCFEQYTISAVMHFSAFANVGESVLEPARYYQNNVVNTLNLLNTMQHFECRRIVFSSTCATYGVPKNLPLTEDHQQHPVNPYGQSKLMVETILRDYANAYGIQHINLRYFNAAGADPDGEIGEDHSPETHLIPLVIQAAIGKRPAIQIFGDNYETPDGTCIRDYIHVNDLAQAHILALQHIEKTGKSDAFNLGNGVGYSVREVIQAVERVGKRPVPIQIVARRAGDPAVLVGSSDKAKTILGWQPRYAALDQIVETAWGWHTK